MNEFLAFDDADWELASAYLDNEATPAERAQVEASPALLGLVADLRSMQSSVATPAPVAIDRDAMIAAALAGTAASVEGDVVGRIPGGIAGGELAPPQAVAPVTSISAARTRRAGFGRTPLLLAAALVTVMGIGFALKSGSGGESRKTSTAATSVAKALPADSNGITGASADQEATTAAAATRPAATAAPAPAAATTAVPAAGGAATTAAAAATTAAPAAASTSASGSGATTSAPETFTSTTAAPAGSAPPTTAAGSPVPTLTLQELKDLVVANAANPTAASTLVCPDPRGVPRLSVQILWNGQPAIVYVDPISQTLVVLAVNGCTPVANIPLKDLAQS